MSEYLAEYLVDYLAEYLMNYLMEYSMDYLVDYMLDYLVDYLADYLERRSNLLAMLFELFLRTPIQGVRKLISQLLAACTFSGMLKRNHGPTCDSASARAFLASLPS